MPRRWTLVLHGGARPARRMRAHDCHGLLNAWWPQEDGEHAEAKRWAAHGLPRPVADGLWSWTVNWLDDDRDPPLDPADLRGRECRIGDHRLAVHAVVELPHRDYARILDVWRQDAPTVRDAWVHTRSPVLFAARDDRGRRVWLPRPDTRRLFGFVREHPVHGLGGSGALGGAVRFAPRPLVVDWLAEVEGVPARLEPGRVEHDPVRVVGVEAAGGHPVRGWEGGVRLEAADGDAAALASLLALVEYTGAGKYTAYGFGALRVDSATAPGGGRGTDTSGELFE
ncbi:CRISPR system precrRNA processing endoribonuclease RAMP protein Cas6 [Thermobifida halotolerans]|uniref:CRISPR system precrRNA processing endoribonuclease RAMP protein Cas6 n=1 Tax=Thermobifida halotolerans TaxID=483545 RepID=A0AA97LY59_9ACTN|nr:CRISPR system precrRNA processing endoribonuclease RAMP protein Cas6 [Thermobifida halotolerans]UOE20412.1 CRISPR system precrRNA processing endoribonuclease RAMP protein Cas6 [Thermobifida halotolerans]